MGTDQGHLSAIRENTEDNVRTSEEILEEMAAQGLLMLDALSSISAEMKIMNIHLSLMTNEHITKEEVE